MFDRNYEFVGVRARSFMDQAVSQSAEGQRRVAIKENARRGKGDVTVM
jgi:hypothetical protein